MVDAGVTTVVLSKLQEVASAEVTALLKVDDQIRNLRRGLVYLQAEVRGADQQRHGHASELLLLWAREARTVTFDVEDAVDEFHLKVEAFQVWGKSSHTWYGFAVRLLNGLAMQFFVRHGLSREIAKINERIEEISKIKNSYNIQSTPSKCWSTPSLDIDVVWDIEGGSTEFRGYEFEALIEQILNPDELIITHPGRANISIIHGESGTGKSRLARKLYNDRWIREKFDVLAWICLPPRVRFGQLEDMILKKVRSQVGKKKNDTTSETLKVLLEGRKYLVVLDGLVDIGNWNCLLDLLPGQAENPESRIVVTTQLKVNEIVNIKHANPNMKRIMLGPLDMVETGLLFSEQVFGYADAPDWNKLKKDFSKRVYSVTRGLPLAVIVLGGILRTKACPSEWKEVFAEKLETSMGEPKAMRCLWLLALEELPDHLKSCFLYLATASENILLDPARMVRLWIAEGFVVPRKGQTLEEVGLSYLKELNCRGLVEVAEKDARGGIKRVTAHSLLHSFVQAEAQESSFLEIHHNAGVLNPHAVRRLAIHNFVDSYVDIPDGFPKLRSLLCDFLEEEQDNGCGGPGTSCSSSSVRHGLQPWWPRHNNPAEWLMRACAGGSVDGPAAGTSSKKLHQLSIIKGSRFLRVIDLYGLLLQRVPDEIGTIIHLRYLGIRNCRLSELPASISKLDNLQTLDMRKTQVKSVTDEFWELRGLRHVLADELLLPKCPSSHLKQLQTLTAVVPTPAWLPPDEGCCPLNHMIYLRSLTVCSIPDSTDVVRALLLALQKMEFLVSLTLSGQLLPSGVFTNPTSRCLRDLALHGKLDSLPSSPFILPNLGKLTLSRSGNLGEDFIKNFSELPNLAEMELLDGSYSGTQLIFDEGGFLSLTKLTLKNLAELEELKLKRGCMPELAILTYCGCKKMKLYDDRSTLRLSSSWKSRMVSDGWIPGDGTDPDLVRKEEEEESQENSHRVEEEESQENSQSVEGTNRGGTSNLILNREEDFDDEILFVRSSRPQ